MNRALPVVLVVLAACSRADARLNDAVRDAVGHEPTALRVEIVTTERIVTLTGIVPTEDDRDRIERRAREVPGVLGVDNRLAVAGPVQTTGAPEGR